MWKKGREIDIRKRGSCFFINDSCLKIIRSINIHSKIKENLADCIIRTFVKSVSFDIANEMVVILTELEPFTDNQVNEIIRGFIINIQLNNAYDVRPFVKELCSKYIKIVIPKLLNAFNKKFNETEN